MKKFYKILVCDDTSDVRLVLSMNLKKIFAKLGTTCEVDEAENGSDLLNILEVFTDDYDLILLDLSMPGIDGLKAFELLKERQIKKAPILIITAMNNPEFVKKSAELGAAGYLLKPVLRDVLEEKIKSVLDLS